MSKRSRDELIEDAKDRAIAAITTPSQLKAEKVERASIIGLIVLLLQLLLDPRIPKNQRKWQDDWNDHAKVLEGRVPLYPKKRLMR